MRNLKLFWLALPVCVLIACAPTPDPEPMTNRPQQDLPLMPQLPFDQDVVRYLPQVLSLCANLAGRQLWATEQPGSTVWTDTISAAVSQWITYTEARCSGDGSRIELTSGRIAWSVSAGGFLFECQRESLASDWQCVTVGYAANTPPEGVDPSRCVERDGYLCVIENPYTCAADANDDQLYPSSSGCMLVEE